MQPLDYQQPVVFCLNKTLLCLTCVSLILVLALQVKMVTGDQHAIAVETCKRLGLGTNIMEGSELMAAKTSDRDFAQHVDEVDGFAGVYPEHKHRIVAALQSKGRLVGMTGDAPPTPFVPFTYLMFTHGMSSACWRSKFSHCPCSISTMRQFRSGLLPMLKS